MADHQTHESNPRQDEQQKGDEERRRGDDRDQSGRVEGRDVPPVAPEAEGKRDRKSPWLGGG